MPRHILTLKIPDGTILGHYILDGTPLTIAAVNDVFYQLGDEYGLALPDVQGVRHGDDLWVAIDGRDSLIIKNYFMSGQGALVGMQTDGTPYLYPIDSGEAEHLLAAEIGSNSAASSKPELTALSGAVLGIALTAGGIAPLVYALRVARFNKSCRNLFAKNFARERKELNDKIHGTVDGCKAFDDETGKQIGFGKNETVGIALSVTDAPHIRRIADARIDKRFRIFKHFVRMSRREHAHAYLRFSVDNARTDKSACSRKHFARASVGTFAFGKRRIFSAAPVGCKVFYMRDFVVEYPRKALYDFPFFFRF